MLDLAALIFAIAFAIYVVLAAIGTVIGWKTIKWSKKKFDEIDD